MKIFFAVSPRAIAEYKNEYRSIYETLRNLGHEHLNDIPINADPNTFYQLEEEEISKMYRELMGKIRQADVIVVDTTIHSLTMGYYIKAALDLEKPVIILYTKGNKPFFFSGIENDKLQIVEYSRENLTEMLKQALSYAEENLDVRFNLFLSPELNNYLKWAAQRFNTQRSNLVRNLIIEHKTKYEEEYKEDIKK